MAATRYEVSKDDHLVLSFSAEPGVLVSTALRPPGFEPPKHPFVNAQAHDAMHETRIAGILTAAKSVDGFVAALKKAGYDVKKVS